MAYYHCSPTTGLTVLEPKKPAFFEKPKSVYMTTSLPMALIYGVRNFEYSYGYSRDGQIYYEEYFGSMSIVGVEKKHKKRKLCRSESFGTIFMYGRREFYF